MFSLIIQIIPLYLSIEINKNIKKKINNDNSGSN